MPPENAPGTDSLRIISCCLDFLQVTNFSGDSGDWKLSYKVTDGVIHLNSSFSVPLENTKNALIGYNALLKSLSDAFKEVKQERKTASFAFAVSSARPNTEYCPQFALCVFIKNNDLATAEEIMREIIVTAQKFYASNLAIEQALPNPL